MKSIYTPNDFAHLSSDWEMIQAAIDEAKKRDASVVIPAFNERTGKRIWEIDKTIILYTGSYVTIDNAHIRLVDDTYIHFFENEASANDGWWLSETKNYDITLIGRGNAVLDGGNHNGIFEKTFNKYDREGNYIGKATYKGLNNIAVNRGLSFRNIKGITVSGLKFINQRYWAMCFEFCSYGHVSDITFEALANVPNQDGIDIREGCNNFLVENICGKTGDDTIALTNFGLSSLYGGNEMTDMDVDIHDIIIKNVRSYLTDECDMIRLLSRGGNKIYNIQISNVEDITPEYSEGRALCGVMIGALCDYPSRLNELGEIRNITIRDVISRARFGVYVANTLADSVFENIMMTADGGIGMYFNGCELKNIFIDKLIYNSLAKAPNSLLGFRSKFHRFYIDQLNALHFNNSTAENLFISNVVSGKNLSYVFGGNSKIDIKATNIAIQDKNTKLTDQPNII